MKHNYLFSFLSRLSKSLKHKEVTFCLLTKKKYISILDMLYHMGYLNYHVKKVSLSGFFFVEISWKTDLYLRPILQGLSVICTPSFKRYVNYKGDTFYSKSNFYKKNFEVFFVSTKYGIYPHYWCEKHKVGGYLLFKLY